MLQGKENHEMAFRQACEHSSVAWESFRPESHQEAVVSHELKLQERNTSSIPHLFDAIKDIHVYEMDFYCRNHVIFNLF